MIGKILKWVVTVVSVVILTSLSIDAADHLDNFSDSLLGSAVNSILPSEPRCPLNMVLVADATHEFCIDMYEASVGEDCIYEDPQNQDQTRQNLDMVECLPVSVEGEKPWRFISQNQAVLACAKAGKRLPTNTEWYTASLGTPDVDRPGRDDCNVKNNWKADKLGETGTGIECVSTYGVYDMIGNVWEWVNETTNGGKYNGRTLPESGFVSSVDESGVPTEATSTRDSNYYDDRFWADHSAVTGIFRGGYWDSQTDGGIYSVHAQVPPSFVGTGVGFRCVK